ncbi:MAG: FtsQ-type POTRA domain-containing protein [Burkholderiaceae bacterium]|nr:FtsQ-type POTRA domain-containing protein [Burkholderiaceae bacterium]
MTLWQDARALNLVAGAMTMVAFASLIVAGLWWLANRPMFELESIEIGPVPGRALEHVSIPSLRASHLNRFTGNFFTVDLDRVRQAFEDAPWVRRAQVRRVWPNRLFVGIEEHRPLAQWGDGRFVNTFGEPFRVNPEEVDDRAALLEFAGPEGTQAMVTRRYAELRTQLQPLELEPRKLVLSERQAWSAQLDNGITLLIGRDDGVPMNDRIARWVAVHPVVAARLNERAEVIDLRYPNGFAVRAPGVLGQDTNDKSERSERGSREFARRP